MNTAELKRQAKKLLKEYETSQEFRNRLNSLEGKRKNRRVPAGYICTDTRKLSDGTVLHTSFYKNYFKHFTGYKWDISFCHYFEVLDPATGKVGYMMPSVEYNIFNEPYDFSWTLYTYHCCCRMKERAGKDFFEIMRETADKIVKGEKEFNGSKGENEYILGDNQYHAFGFEDDGIRVVATFVTNDMLYPNQVELAAKLQDIYREYIKEIYAA